MLNAEPRGSALKGNPMIKGSILPLDDTHRDAVKALAFIATSRGAISSASAAVDEFAARASETLNTMDRAVEGFENGRLNAESPEELKEFYIELARHIHTQRDLLNLQYTRMVESVAAATVMWNAAIEEFRPLMEALPGPEIPERFD